MAPLVVITSNRTRFDGILAIYGTVYKRLRSQNLRLEIFNPDHYCRPLQYGDCAWLLGIITEYERFDHQKVTRALQILSLGDMAATNRVRRHSYYLSRLENNSYNRIDRIEI